MAQIPNAPNKAYELGKQAAKDGHPATSNPYNHPHLSSLRAWWNKGYNSYSGGRNGRSEPGVESNTPKPA